MECAETVWIVYSALEDSQIKDRRLGPQVKGAGFFYQANDYKWIEDHSGTVLFIIQISCVLSFTENNSVWMLCIISCLIRDRNEAKGRKTSRYQKQSKMKNIYISWGFPGRAKKNIGQASRKVGSFQTPRRLPSTWGNTFSPFHSPCFIWREIAEWQHKHQANCLDTIFCVIPLSGGTEN